MPEDQQTQPDGDNGNLNAESPLQPVVQSSLQPEKPKRTKLLKLAIPVILLVILAVSGFVFFHNKTDKKGGVQKPDTETYKLFQSYEPVSYVNNSGTITITDSKGNKVNQFAINLPMEIRARLDNKTFLLKEDDEYYDRDLLESHTEYDFKGGNYYILTKDSLTKLGDKANQALRQGTSDATNHSPRRILPISKDAVLFIGCVDQGLECSLKTMNLSSGDIIHTINMGLYSKGLPQSINLLGLDEMKSKALILNDLVMDQNQNAAELNKTVKAGRFPYNILEYDIAGNSIKKTANFSLGVSADAPDQQTYWLSPDASKIAYSYREGTVAIYDIKTGKETTSTLPKGWFTQNQDLGWNSELGNDQPPLWSPDSKLIVFMSNEINGASEFTSSVKVSSNIPKRKGILWLDLTTNKISIAHTEIAYKKGDKVVDDEKNFLNGINWVDNGSIEFSKYTARINSFDIVGFSPKNYSFNTGSGKEASLSSQYGQIMGQSNVNR